MLNLTISLSFIVFFLLLFSACSYASWTQQYGDSSSTNYIGSSNHSIAWNYTALGDEDSASFFYGSPSMSEDGMVFIPFLEIPQYWLQVRAIAPGGKEVWMANWIGEDESCSVVDLSNTLYSSEHNLVIVSWYCTAGGVYHEKGGEVVALNATNGSLVWRSEKLKLLDSASISMSQKTVYVVSGYDCGRDNPVQSLDDQRARQRPHKNDSIIAAIDISTGKLKWTQTIEHSGCDGQLKISYLPDNSILLLVLYNLPYGPYLTGSLLGVSCLEDQGSVNCSSIWQENLHLSYEAKFAFTAKGSFAYGSYGFAGNPDLIFGLNTEDGKLEFSSHGYCDEGSYPSGPSVDGSGIAYYNCGNRVFSVNTKGKLIWKSKQLSNKGYTFETLFKQSPSIHTDKNLVVSSDSEGEFIYILSMEDGSLKNSFNTTLLLSNSVITEPPILYGDNIYIIKATKYVDYYLFSLPLI